MRSEDWLRTLRCCLIYADCVSNGPAEGGTCGLVVPMLVALRMLMARSDSCLNLLSVPAIALPTWAMARGSLADNEWNSAVLLYNR